MKAYMTGNKKQKNKQGFTLFYALLVASLALAIGASIFDITLREIDLSNAATQSQYAVYVADSGAECALYWDSKYVNAGTNNNGGSNSAFATSSTDAQFAISGTICNGVDVAVVGTPPSPVVIPQTAGNGWTAWNIATGPSAATTTFAVIGTTYKNQTPCAVVYVAKVGNPAVTTVTSHGYNTCVAGPLQLERVFQVSY